MGDFDFLSDTPTPQDILRAQALALRKQNDPSALKQQADQGMLLSAAHNSGLQNMGHQMVGNSQVMSGETSPRLAGAMKTMQEGEAFRRAQMENDANDSPQAGLAYRTLLKNLGTTVTDDTPTPTLRALLPIAEKAYAAKLLRTSPNIYINPQTGQAYDRHGSLPATQPGQPGQAPQVQPLAGKPLDKALQALGADFDPSSGRAGEFGKNQARYNASNRFLALAQTPDGKAADLNPQQMAEAAQSLVSLISSGGAGAQSQIEHMLPKSYTRDVAGIEQYLTSEPHGAGQVAFVQNMIDTAKREQAIAQQAIESVRKQRAGKHQLVLRSNPAESKRLLNGFGWDLGDDGVPTLKQAEAPAAATDLRKKYGL